MKCRPDEPLMALVFAVAIAASAISAHAADLAEIRLPDTSPFPESVTSTSDGALFVSSVVAGGVVKVAPDGKAVTTFVKPGEHDTRSTFGVLADERRGMLWVASNDASPIGIRGPTAVEGAWIKGFDLKSGENRISIRLPVSPAIANDFALGPDGALYVSNTMGTQIFRLKPGNNELEVFVDNDALKGGLDGLAFGEDGALYANTFIGGELFRIEAEDGSVAKVTKLRTSTRLTHPDGLRAFDGGLVMVEGAGSLDRITISGDEAKIEPLKQLAGPTGLTISGDTIWVSEGQLSYLTDPDKKGMPFPTFYLRAVPLPKK